MLGRPLERPVPSEADIIHDYFELRLPAAELDRKYSRFYQRLRQYGLSPRGHALTELQRTSFTADQLQIIYGVVMGDGYLCVPSGCRWPCLSVEHSRTQENYVLWLHQALKPFSAKLAFCEPRASIYNGRPISGVGSVRFRIGVHPQLQPVYDTFYPGGSRTFTAAGLDCLDTLALAVWYMDDGTYQGQARTCRKPYGQGEYHYDRREASLCTGSRPPEEQQLLVDWFQQRWGCLSRRRFLKNAGWRITFYGDDAERFLALVGPHIAQVPSMAYKVNSAVKVLSS